MSGEGGGGVRPVGGSFRPQVRGHWPVKRRCGNVTEELFRLTLLRCRLVPVWQGSAYNIGVPQRGTPRHHPRSRAPRAVRKSAVAIWVPLCPDSRACPCPAPRGHSLRPSSFRGPEAPALPRVLQSNFLFEEEFLGLTERLLKGVLEHFGGGAPPSPPASATTSPVKPAEAPAPAPDVAPPPPPAAGGTVRPGLGFAVRQARGKPGLYIADVAPGGAADLAGVEEGDELLWVKGEGQDNATRVDSLKTLHEAHVRLLIPGTTVRLKALRHGTNVPKTVEVVVGEPATDGHGLDPIDSLDDLAARLANPPLLQGDCAALCRWMDGRRCGAVTLGDFAAGLKAWLGPAVASVAPDAVVAACFARYDEAGTGHLPTALAAVLLQSLLRLMGDYVASVRCTEHKVYAGKYAPPVDTHAVYEQWRPLGWISGTFSEAVTQVPPRDAGPGGRASSAAQRRPQRGRGGGGLCCGGERPEGLAGGKGCP